MAVAKKKACVFRLFACVSEAHFYKTAESHFARLAFQHEAKSPALCTAAANAQIKTAAIGVETWLARARNLESGQSLYFFRQFAPPEYPPQPRARPRLQL